VSCTWWSEPYATFLVEKFYVKEFVFDTEYYSVCLHRDDGPAHLIYDKGTILECHFYLKGDLLPFWDFYGKVSEVSQKALLKNWIHYS
jgi:hypothetical protein